MEVKDVTDIAVYLGTVAGALIAIGVVVRYLLVRPFKRWLMETVGEPVQQVAAEVGATSESGAEQQTLRELVIEHGFRLNALEQRYATHLEKLHR